MTNGRSYICTRADSCKTMLDIYGVCQDFVRAYKFDYFSFLRTPKENDKKLSDLVMLSNWPVSLVNNYDASGFFSESSFANKLKQDHQPFNWSVTDMYADSNENVLQVTPKPFRDNNMSYGIGFNVKSESGEEGVVVLNQGHNQHQEEKFDEMEMRSSRIFNRIVELKQVAFKKANKLSKREYECLLWTSEGKTSYEIGMILGLSENTINNYLVTVGRKLGAVNRPHMVGIALRKGYI